MLRQSGRTTKQIQEAPMGALFVRTGPKGYTEALAHALGRTDLEIVGLDYFVTDRWRGKAARVVVVDHAALEHASQRQWDALQEAVGYWGMRDA